jgi:hypothetical protein
MKDKEYTVFWRFKGKEYLETPLNSCSITAASKKEAAAMAKESCDSIKIIRIDLAE